MIVAHPYSRQATFGLLTNPLIDCNVPTVKWIAAIVASLVEHVAAGFACGACHLRKWPRGVAPAAASRPHRQCAQVLNMALLFKKTGQGALSRDLSDLRGRPVWPGRRGRTGGFDGQTEATRNGARFGQVHLRQIGWLYLFAGASRRDTCVERGGQYNTLGGMRPPSVGGLQSPDFPSFVIPWAGTSWN